MKKALNTTFKALMLVLILVSVGLLVWGFAAKWGANAGDKPVDVLINWTYVMIALAAIAWIVVGLIISVMNNPKSLVKYLIAVVAVAAICGVAYVLAPGSEAIGLATEMPSQSTLKITDTVLNLTYFAAGLAIASIIVGEIIMAIRNKN